MCNWKRWVWPGILAAIILTVIALWMRSADIEADLTTRSTAALTSAGYSWSELEVDGRDMKVGGLALTEEGQAQAAATVAQTYGVRVVEDNVGLVPAQSPYVFSASKTGNAISVNGFVPNQEERSRVLETVATAIGSADITDNLEVGRGAADGFAELSDFALEQLAGLSQGNVELNDLEMTASGIATDLGSYRTITSALDGELPGGGALIEQSILAPAAEPYIFRADVADNGITLTGNLPIDGASDELVAAAGRLEIDDQTQLASGEPEGFNAASAFALESAGGLASGSVSITGNADSENIISIKGIARDSASYDRLIGDFSSALPANVVAGTVEITPPIADPYVFSAARTDAGVQLSGSVPSEAMRDAIIQAATSALGDIEIIDEMVLASNAPDTYRDVSSFAFTGLAGLTEGTISATAQGNAPNTISVSGVAKDGDSYRALVTAFDDGLPENTVAGTVDVTPPGVDPYTISAIKSADGIQITGYAPSSEINESIISSFSGASEGEVSSNIELSTGQPENFSDYYGFMAEQLSRLSSGAAVMVNSEISISGQAKTSQNYSQILSALADGLPEGAERGVNNVTPPSVAQYRWGIARDGSQVDINGFVANPAVRTQLSEQVGNAFTGTQISDSSSFASGAPAYFDEASNLAIDSLSKLVGGEAGFDDAGFYVRGEARSLEDYADLNDLLANRLPEGLALGENGVTPAIVSPYVWQAEKTDNDTIVLSGLVPSEEARDELVDAASAVGSVDDQMVLAAGAPEAFLQGAVFGLNQLSELQKGAAKLSDENYSIEGQAGNGDVMTAQIASGLKPPAGLVADGVSIAPPIVENYQWLAEKQDGDFTLTGFAPSAMARGELVNALTVVQPNANIDNQLEIAGGAPEAYGAGTAYALDLLADLEPGSATLEGNRFSVSGVASSVEAYERLVGKRGSLPEGLELDAFSIEPATVEPYGFALEIAGANATLSGFAPSADLKAAAETATNGALRFSEISNGLKIAAGLPGNIDYDATMSFAADQLSKMTAGRFAVENDELSISGAARSDAEFDSIQSALADNLPAGLTIVMQEITLPVIDPYVWSAERRGDTVSLAGYGPSSQDIEGISASATSRFSGLTVKNEIQRAGGAPRGFDSAVSVALSILGRMKEGRAKLTGTELTVTGETFTQALRDTLTTRVENGLPPGFTGSAAITAPVLEPVAPNRCGPLVAARMDGAKIQFESAKSVIREESFGLLDEITGIVLRCPETRLEVNGHTDSDGRDTYNQRLSEARANAVRTYLIEGGVDALRVRARGFGETEPIADNETDEGKALNRRIEFEVIEN